MVSMFSHVVETERRFYLANDVTVTPHSVNGDVWFELELRDAWVWDMYRPARFISQVRVLTFRDVNVEELTGADTTTPPFLHQGSSLWASTPPAATATASPVTWSCCWQRW